jgi:multiple antibiotic resistance protein
MNAFESMLVTLAALLPIVNPLGNAPIFLAMSADLPVAGRRRLATIAARNAFLLLAAALVIGSYVLRFFGISLPVVRVAGGMVLIASGWRLLHSGDPDPGRQPRMVEAWEREADRRGFYPLTFPLTVGPGSISIAITLGARSVGAVRVAALELLGNLLGAALISVAIYLSYRFASRLIDWLGETGTDVFLRLSAFVLLCVGVSVLWGGVAGLLATLR